MLGNRVTSSRARLIRRLIAESLVLASAGGLLGVLLARWTMPALLAIKADARILRR